MRRSKCRIEYGGSGGSNDDDDGDDDEYQFEGPSVEDATQLDKVFAVFRPSFFSGKKLTRDLPSISTSDQTKQRPNMLVLIFSCALNFST